MRPVTRRLLPIIALVTLLAALSSTEAAEVWCRVAVGATMDRDDDDGPYFTYRQAADITCRQAANITQARPGDKDGVRSPVRRPTAERSSVSSAPRDGCVVDEPTFSLPRFGLSVAPGILPRISVSTVTVAYAVEMRGPPTQSGRFVRPPPRAPPAS